MKSKILLLMVSCLFGWGGSLPLFSAPGDDFNPENPGDPQAVNFCKIIVSANPAKGAYVSGSGRYTVNGEQVYISTNANNTQDYTYTFMYWTMNGKKTNYSQDFWFTPTKGTFEFVAHYKKTEVVFDPDNPSDPSSSTVRRRYFLYLTSSIEGACSFNMDSGNRIKENSQLDINVNLNLGYQFDGWKLNGQIISCDPYLYFTMPGEDTTLEAVISEIPFDPDSPVDPQGAGGNVDNATRMLIDLKLFDSKENSDKTRVVINESKSLDYETDCDAAKFVSDEATYQFYSLDAKKTKYAINERPKDKGEVPLGMIVKKSGQLAIAATRLDCTAILVDKVLQKEFDLALGDYTFSCGKGTFNNRFLLKLPSVLLGDANGDGKVDKDDVDAVVLYIIGTAIDGFVFNGADVNKDKEVNATDLVKIISIMQSLSAD